MSRLYALILCATVFWNAACTGTRPNNAPDASETAAVFSAVLEYKFAGSSRETITILNRSSHFGHSRYLAFYGDTFIVGSASNHFQVLKEQFPDIQDELVCEFLRTFSAEHRFERELELKTSRTIEVLDEPIGEWPIFGRFSQVAFDRTGRQAFVLFDFECGALCGSGDHFLLQKEDGGWRVVKQYEGWRS
jgi:hypothetical protein